MAHRAVRHELIGPLDARGRWPGFAFDGPVLHQPDAGRLWADRIVAALHERAGTHGARLRFNEPVRALMPLGDDRALVTTDVEQYRAPTVVVTAGAWVADVLAGLVDLPPLTVTREQVFHFPSGLDVNAVWPSYIHHGSTFVYGLQGPADEGVKVAEHHVGCHLPLHQHRRPLVHRRASRPHRGRLGVLWPRLQVRPSNRTPTRRTGMFCRLSRDRAACWRQDIGHL